MWISTFVQNIDFIHGDFAIFVKQMKFEGGGRTFGRYFIISTIPVEFLLFERIGVVVNEIIFINKINNRCCLQ